MRPAAPERTCVGCRRRRPQHELVRLHVRDGKVVPAQPGDEGRSAYLCPDEKCLTAAEKKRAFARAFRGPANPDPAVRRVVTRSATARCGSAAPRPDASAAARDERR